MCGIAGFIDTSSSARTPMPTEQVVRHLCDAMAHRGPDGYGIWKDPEYPGLALGHRRLSVIDLTEAGHQPMISASGRYVITFNGEIYNFESLRAKVRDKYEFRSETDTEVVLALIDVLGISQALDLIQGMFAFAIWDRFEQCLMLARDRFGEKPLYYGMVEGNLVFSSELKGFKTVFGSRIVINEVAVADYFRYGNVAAPLSIFQGIKKLQPGHVVRISLTRDGILNEHQPELYWQFDLTMHSKGATAGGISFGSALSGFTKTFEAVVAKQMVADVPLGAFLSGGYDSTAVVAAMSAQATGRVNTFTIGFDSPEHDESMHARAIAKYFGTQHEEFRVTEKDILAEVSSISEKYDEPFSDSSQVPTYIVSRCARSKVTVCLTGDGGDELFGGYSRYHQVQTLFRTLKLCPPKVRSIMADIALKTLTSPKWWSSSVRLDRLLKATSISDFDGFLHLYDNVASSIGHHSLLAQDLLAGHHENHRLYHPVTRLSDARNMMWRDTHDYLCNDILVKVDRASMACSLETRAPFLDHGLSQFVWGLPDSFLLPEGGKRLLKEYVHSKIDRSLVDRPKSGFSVPLAKWLRGPLKDWWQDTVFQSFRQGNQWLNEDNVRQLWLQHQSGKRNWHTQLWTVAMFCDWLNKNC